MKKDILKLTDLYLLIMNLSFQFYNFLLFLLVILFLPKVFLTDSFSSSELSDSSSLAFLVLAERLLFLVLAAGVTGFLGCVVEEGFFVEVDCGLALVLAFSPRHERQSFKQLHVLLVLEQGTIERGNHLLGR